MILPHHVFHAGEQPWLPLMNRLLALSELQLMSVGIVLVVKVECWLTLLFWLVLFLRGMRMAMIKMRANASLYGLRSSKCYSSHHFSQKLQNLLNLLLDV